MKVWNRLWKYFIRIIIDSSGIDMNKDITYVQCVNLNIKKKNLYTELLFSITFYRPNIIIVCKRILTSVAIFHTLLSYYLLQVWPYRSELNLNFNCFTLICRTKQRKIITKYSLWWKYFFKFLKFRKWGCCSPSATSCRLRHWRWYLMLYVKRAE